MAPAQKLGHNLLYQGRKRGQKGGGKERGEGKKGGGNYGGKFKLIFC